MGMTFCSICLSPNADSVLGSTTAIFGLPTGLLCIPDLEQVEETCHHKHLADLLVDVLDDHLASLCRCLLADGEEEAESGAADVLQIGTVERDGLVGILN